MTGADGAAEHVDRPDDPRIADYSRVGDPVWLKANGLFVAEGRLVVRRLLREPRFAIRSILVTTPALEALAGTDRSRPEIDAAPQGNTRLHRAGESLTRVFVAPQAVLKAVTGFDFHRGCVALVERPGEPKVEDVARGARILVLEGVGNPDNVGGLFRVGAAFGASGVLLDPASGDPFYRKAIRTSMGAGLVLPHARLRPWPDALKIVHDLGFTLVALSPKTTTSIQDVAAAHLARIALLVGNEGAGLSAGALSAADMAAQIPMPGGIDSLNVTVAAGIALSHLA